MLNKLLTIITPICVFFSCQNSSDYSVYVKQEMATGKYIDSLQFGLKFGDSKKTFFTKCWELNSKGIVSHGPNNEFVAYELDNLPEGNKMNHLFYGIFNEENIMIGLNMRFYYLGWAPWNSHLMSDSVLPIAMRILKEWYPGNDFSLLENESYPNDTYIKVDGNRQLIVRIIDEKNVWAQLLDLKYKYPDLVHSNE